MSKVGTEVSGGNMTFYGIIDGDIVNRVSEDTEGAVPRVLTKGANEGKVIYEKHNNYVEGFITGGGIVIKEFGKKKVPEVQVWLDDDAQLQIPMTMLMDIGEVLPNVDRTLPLKIKSVKTKAGKPRLLFSQDGNKVESYFVDWEKDENGKWKATHKNGLPEVTYDEVDGYDFRDRDKFLKVVVNDFFSQYVSSKTAEDSEGKTEDEEEVPF